MPIDFQHSLHLILLLPLETKETTKMTDEIEVLVSSLPLHKIIYLTLRRLTKLTLCLTTSACATQRPTFGPSRIRLCRMWSKLIWRAVQEEAKGESSALSAKKLLNELPLSASCPVTSSISSMLNASNHGSRNKMLALFAKVRFQSARNACLKMKKTDTKKP